MVRVCEVFVLGILGMVKMSKVWNCQCYVNCQFVFDGLVLMNVNYDMWFGLVFKCFFNLNCFYGKWNWYCDYGNGDIGGDGIHDIDLVRWGLGVIMYLEWIMVYGSWIDFKGECEFFDNMMVVFYYLEGKVLFYEDWGWMFYGFNGFDSSNVFYGMEGMMVFLW